MMDIRELYLSRSGRPSSIKMVSPRFASVNVESTVERLNAAAIPKVPKVEVAPTPTDESFCAKSLPAISHQSRLITATGGMSLRGGIPVGNIYQARDHNYAVVSPEFKTDPGQTVSDTAS